MVRKTTCNECGCEKEAGYENDSRCRACRSAFNKAKRSIARLSQGKKPWGEGRSIYCAMCKKEKEPGRDNESCCKKCKSDAGKARRLAARLERGQQPLGVGRNPNCYTCGALKENPNVGYCNACHRQRDSEWRIATGRTKNRRTGKCRCGNEFATYSKCYCTSCASAWRKQYLKEHPEQAKKVYDRANGKRFESLDEFIKYCARYTTLNAIKRGLLVRGVCEVCGSSEKVEAHHSDYTKPFDITWLCKKHHSEHHLNEKRGLTK